MSGLKQEFSRALRAALIEQKISVTSAAKVLNVSRQSMHSYLNGSSMPHDGTLAIAIREWDLRFAVGGISVDASAFPEQKLSSVPLQPTLAGLFDSIKAEDLKLHTAKDGNTFRISVSIQVA
jgi:predicted transcriptional regulator